jgi:hypothetical protein
MNTPTIILPQQFQVEFDMLADTISFIRPGSPYDTTDKYYKATLKFGSDSQNVSTYNVKHDGDYLYNIINDLKNPPQLTTSDITHTMGSEQLAITKTLKEYLLYIQDSNNTHIRSNGDKVNLKAFLNYLDDSITVYRNNLPSLNSQFPPQQPVIP